MQPPDPVPALSAVPGSELPAASSQRRPHFRPGGSALRLRLRTPAIQPCFMPASRAPKLPVSAPGRGASSRPPFVPVPTTFPASIRAGLNFSPASIRAGLNFFPASIRAGPDSSASVSKPASLSSGSFRTSSSAFVHEKGRRLPAAPGLVTASSRPCPSSDVRPTMLPAATGTAPASSFDPFPRRRFGLGLPLRRRPPASASSASRLGLGTSHSRRERTRGG